MVQAKQHKSRAKKQPQAKKQGKEADITQFRAQLDALGLKIVHVTADGNCFFRALADQLEGNEDEHGKYRSMVVQYIQKNSEMFEPFVEDEVPFEEYCKSMGNDGTWAGHMELQAASLVTCSNICIHRNQSPRWYIQNFDEPGVRMIHLSYHDGEHYNSVRLKEDTGSGPARPIIIKADSNISSSSSRQVKAGLNKSKEELGENTIDSGSIKLVMAGTGCENFEKAKQTLLQMEGDVDAAIEYLVAGQGLEDFSEEIDQFPSNHEFIGHDANGESEEQNEEPSEVTYKEDPPSSSAKRTHDDCNATHNKKISRNKACPCGSKKKYKSCCGSGMGSSTVSLIDQSSQFRKGRNEKKRGKRGGLNTSATLSGSDVGPPDMGALCI